MMAWDHRDNCSVYREAVLALHISLVHQVHTMLETEDPVEYH